MEGLHSKWYQQEVLRYFGMEDTIANNKKLREMMYKNTDEFARKVAGFQEYYKKREEAMQKEKVK